MKNYFIFLLLPIFVACSHAPTSVITPSLDPVKKIQIPAELLQSCPIIASVDPALLEDILLEDLDIIQSYGACRTKHKRLVEAVQEVTK